MNFLNELNKEQQQIITSSEKRIIALSGAGTGKTRVLTYKIANDILKGANPSKIMAVTFTNKAAKEIKDRLNVLLKNNVKINAGTFHGISYQYIRKYYQYLGFNKQPTVIDESDQINLIKIILENYETLKETPAKNIAAAHNNYRRECKNDIAEMRILARKKRMTTEIIDVFEEYQERKKKYNYVDFDDLLFLMVKLLSTLKIKDQIRKDTEYLYVDEFQDINEIQYDLINLIYEPETNIFVVGDDAQSIYGWNGSDPMILHRFIQDYSPKQFAMEQNYRSTSGILEVANELIKHNEKQLPKSLWSKKDNYEKVSLSRFDNSYFEAGWIASKIKQLSKTYEYSDIAVLCRTNLMTLAIQKAFIRARIPFQVIGPSMLDRIEVKDTSAYLRLAVNPDDNLAFERIVNIPNRKIGKTTVDKILNLAERNNMSAFNYLISDLPSKTIKDKTNEFINLINSISFAVKNYTIPMVIDYIWELTDYITYINKKRKDNVKIDMLKELKDFSKTFNDIDEFLFALSSHSPENNENDNKVKIMTLHSSKGLEFKIVFIPGIVESLLPHSNCYSDDEIEEERRLFYVGITRAEDLLYLSYSDVYNQFDKNKLTAPSRFLFEIPKHLIEHPTKKKIQII